MGFFTLLRMSNLKNLKVFCILQGEGGRNFREKKQYVKHPYKYPPPQIKKQKNNAANHIEKFNVPTVSTAMFIG